MRSRTAAGVVGCLVTTAIGLASLGCGSAERAPSNDASSSVDAASPAAHASSSSPEPAEADEPAALPSSPEPAPRFPGQPFPPADLVPMHEKSAKQGDGVWTRVGSQERGELVASVEPPVMVQTVLRPHPISPLATLTLAAVDLERVQIDLVAGTSEPTSDVKADRPGRVPEDRRDRVLAVFNGGYKASHGGWGFRADGVTLIPPKPDGCAIASLTNGELRIGTWQRLETELENAELPFLRQTPPCLVDAGAIHPSLIAGQDKAWGGRDPNRKTRRRSAVGLSSGGRTLLYAVGFELTPKLLAEGLRHAGAEGAAQLDINWYWTRFLVVGEGGARLTSTLVPDMEHSPKGYVESPQERDFFYVWMR